MSLFESGHSNGQVSLAALLDGRRQLGAGSGLSVPELMQRIVIGGWPDLLDAEEADAREWLQGYLRQIIEVDMRIYAQALGGRVDAWRDAGGHEVDAIVSFPGRRWAAFEVKMSQSDVDTAANNLLKFSERVDTQTHGEPAALVVITATGAAGQRSDGVHVVPITALAP